MDPFVHYATTYLRRHWERVKAAARDHGDAGLTSTELALLVGGLLVVAAGVIVAITARANQEKGGILGR